MCPDGLPSLSLKAEPDRYAPFVTATNIALEELELLDIPGLKPAPTGADRIIFFTNHPHEIQIQSGAASSNRKPDVVVMRLSDAAQAYDVPQGWAQLKDVAPNSGKPQSFHKILSCIEFKAVRTDMTMSDFLKDDTPSLAEIDPMHLMVYGKKKVDSQSIQLTLSGSDRKKRPRSPSDDSETRKRSTKRLVVEAGPSRVWYPRAAKGAAMPQAKAIPKQTTGSGSQPKTPQEKVSDSKIRDPILQTGSYAVEMISMFRVHIWNILIIGTCPSLGRGYFIDGNR
jgi:hypothetical protein